MKAIATQTVSHGASDKKQRPAALSVPVAPHSVQAVDLPDPPFIQRKTALCTCGGGCPRCRLPKGLQAKLRVSVPGDAFEQEADRVAEQVMESTAQPALQRKCDCAAGTACPRCDSVQEETLRRKAVQDSDAACVSAPDDFARELGPGEPLDAATRAFMESRFGQDFSRVRVHTDAGAAESARSLNARAYTVGRDIAFGAGEYAPGTAAGAKLLAHELAHTIQQTGAPKTRSLSPQPVQVARQPDNPGAGSSDIRDAGDSPPGGVPQPAAQEHAAEPPPVDLANLPDTGEGAVQRVVVSCADNVIAFVTVSGVHIYELSHCEIPNGSYNAGVSVSGNNVTWTLGTHAGRGFQEQAGFTYRIRRGQQNPASLFRHQNSVLVEVVSRVQMPTNVNNQPCQLTMRPRELIHGQHFSTPLFPPQEFERTLWSHTIPLGQFGWVQVSATANAHASGEFSGGYGPGTLSDICMLRHLPNGRLAGHAHFRLPGRLGATVTFTGALRLAGSYLSLIPVAALDGEINASGHAEAQAAFDSDLDVIYDQAAQRWEFTSENALSAEGSLGFRLDTSLAVEFLGRRLWSETWNLLNAQVGASWRGGLTIRPDLSIDLNAGELNVSGGRGGGAAASAMSAGGGGGQQGGSGSSGGGGSSVVDKLIDILSALYNESQAQITSQPVLNPRVIRNYRYALGPPGATLDRQLLEEVFQQRLNNTNMSDIDSYRSNIAVLKAEVNGQVRYFVSPNDPNELHSESLIFRQVEAIDRTYRTIRLLQLYTEREPCGNCRRDLIGIRDLTRQDFAVYFTVPRSVPPGLRAARLMQEYGLNPP